MSSSAVEPEQVTAPRFSWRHLALAAGPGLVAMLAGHRRGSVITVAQSGAQWGYRLLLPNLLLIPFMFMAQELALRLGLGARQGAAELILRHFGRVQAVLLLIALGMSCFGALVSEMSGMAGAAQAFGLPMPVAMVGIVGGLILMVVTGSHRSVGRVAFFLACSSSPSWSWPGARSRGSRRSCSKPGNCP